MQKAPEASTRNAGPGPTARGDVPASVQEFPISNSLNPWVPWYRSWANGKGRMYLLEGLQKLQTKYGMGIGDVLVFR